MQNIQNKIDRLVVNGNDEFSKQRNVIAALVEYTRSVDMYDFIDRRYKIQLHEIYVRIAICWDILGSYNNTLDYLNRALDIVPNVGSLVLYKSVLLQTLGKNDEAQKCLLKYKQISGKMNLSIYESFRLVFYFLMDLDREVLLREINEFLKVYPKSVVVLYLRAMIYMDFSNAQSTKCSEIHGGKPQSHKKNASSEFLVKYEKDIKEAHQIEPTDTEFLIRDGITNDNLTKLFFMVLHEMDNYQPKPLVNYSTFHSGLKIFYIIFKAIRMLKIKVEKRKLKTFYSNMLKMNAEREKKKEAKEVSPDHSNNSFGKSDLSNYTAKESVNESQMSNVTGTGVNKSSTHGNTSEAGNITDVNLMNNSKDKPCGKLNILRGKIKSNGLNLISTERAALKLGGGKTIVNSKSNIEKESIEDVAKGIKKEFETKVKNLYRTVWVHNLKYTCNDISKYDLEADIFTNFFIKWKYYAPYNLAESIIHSAKQTCETKADTTNAVVSTSLPTCNQAFTIKKPVIQNAKLNELHLKSVSHTDKEKFCPLMVNTPSLKAGGSKQSNGNIVNANNQIFTKNSQVLPDLSVSEINCKPQNQYMQEQDSISFSSEINLLEPQKGKDTKNNSQFTEPRPKKTLQEEKRDRYVMHVCNDNIFHRLRLQKLTHDLVKNDVINSKKFLHRPSPRVDWQKIHVNFASFGKDLTKKSEDELKKDIPKSELPDQNVIIDTLQNQSDHSASIMNNNNNPTKQARENINLNAHTNIQGNLAVTSAIDYSGTNRGGGTLRKSIEYGKARIPGEILKKGGMAKPTLFKNLARNLGNRITSAINPNIISKEQSAVKIQRNESGIVGSASMKTSENV